jgi:hypothetical protein
MCVPAALAAVPALLGSFGTAATAMTTAQTIALAASAGSAVLSTVGAYNQAKTAQGMARYNAGVADNAALDATRKGEDQATKARREARQIVGMQRAGYSARGIDIADGTAADMIDQTNFFGEVDVATARTNARREADTYRARSRGYNAEADANSPWMAGAGSLLGSASAVADKWYRYSGK